MSTSSPTVAEVSLQAWSVPTDAPEADGTFAWDATTIVLATVRCDQPGAPAGTGWTYAPAAAAALAEEMLVPVVVGRPVGDVPATWAAMVAEVRNAGRAGVAGTAISALDIALWDLRARLLDVPLPTLWGPVRDEVALYGSGGFTTYDDDTTRRQLGGWTDGGFGAVKIKIGESAGTRVDRDLHRVALARETVGDGVELFVDANGGYDVAQAVRVGHALDELGVTWFEEPVSSEDVAGLREVRSRLRCDVTAGEYGYDLAELSRLVAARAVDCLQIDVTRCGGYTEWLRAAATAAGHHVDVSGHCAPYLSAPVALCTPGLRHLEWFHDHVRIEHALLDPDDTGAGGRLHRSDRPGHGWDPDPGRLAALGATRRH